MSLLTPGFWPSTSWPKSYWPTNNWPSYGSTPCSSAEHDVGVNRETYWIERIFEGQTFR